jgi:hypothetical protein
MIKDYDFREFKFHSKYKVIILSVVEHKIDSY